MNDSWVSDWLVTINSIRSWPQIGFENGSIVSATEWVRVLPSIGATLCVPPSAGAVFTFRSGRRKVFTEGVHWLGGPSFPAGLYPVRYVDLKDQRTAISLTEAFCRDGWRGGLSVEIRWRVRDLTLSVDVADLIGSLAIATRAAVREVIETTPHDQLTGGMSEAIDADSLANQVSDRLNGSVPGIRILRVLITERRGDECRLQIVRETTVERMRALQEQELERLSLFHQTEIISWQTDLERRRQVLALLEAEGKRQQVEEEHEVRIREVILFGSKAQGESCPGSDIEALILVDTDDWRFSYAISRLAARISLDRDVLLAPYVIAESRWRHSTLRSNCLR